MSTADQLVAALTPITAWLAEQDLTDAAGVQAGLHETFPPSSLDEVARLARAGRDAGWLTPRKATPTLSFGRPAKPSAATHGFSIDAVDMSGAGAEHTHPNGEVSLCFAEAGDPRFCGHAAGWVVVPPGSRHVPEVTGGHMLILYFLPDGAMQWH